MDDLEKQVEELEALQAIYGDEWQTEDHENRAYSIVISVNDIHVKLYVKMTPHYPSNSPPNYELSAPHLSKITKNYLSQILENEYLSYIGQPVIFQWIEKIREELLKQAEERQSKTKVTKTSKVKKEKKVIELKCPEIIHGDLVTDRKSTFQGHLAVVNSKEEISLVINKLNENKKISNAAHNVFAYRICLENNNYLVDFDDDGESQAGSRLLKFLETIEAKNILVVVSRWYGGIHLGADRFRHVISAARQVLVTSNLMPVKISSKS